MNKSRNSQLKNAHVQLVYKNTSLIISNANECDKKFSIFIRYIMKLEI